MLLDWFRSKFGTAEKAQPLAVHVLMITFVIVYALAGAVVMRNLEWTEHRPPSIHERMEQIGRRRACLMKAVKQVATVSHNDIAFKHWNETVFDQCYGHEEPPMNDTVTYSTWSLPDAFLFSFTVITTIGYGNIAPKTFGGRLFCIFYGLFGIPLTMLAIADLGKFLAEMATKLSMKVRRRIKKLNTPRNEDGTKRVEEPESLATGIVAFTLLFTFIFYMFIGAAVFPTYEPEMDFFAAVYFNFVTLTTVGLGDIVPKSNDFMLFTLVYIAVGLALTTIAIEIASDYLKQLHYFGRKIQNVANVNIWFGGKRLTMKQLVNNLGDQFDVPVEDIQNLNFDRFVETAIDVEAGKICSIRQQHEEERRNALNKPLLAEDVCENGETVSVGFADDEPMDPRQEESPLLPQSSSPVLKPLLTPPCAHAKTLSVSTFQSEGLGTLDSASVKSECRISPLECADTKSLKQVFFNDTPVFDTPITLENAFLPILPEQLIPPAPTFPSSPLTTPSSSPNRNRGLKPALVEVDKTELGRRPYRHDPQMRHKMYREEWERFKTPGVDRGKTPTDLRRSSDQEDPNSGESISSPSNDAKKPPIPPKKQTATKAPTLPPKKPTPTKAPPLPPKKTNASKNPNTPQGSNETKNQPTAAKKPERADPTRPTVAKTAKNVPKSAAGSKAQNSQASKSAAPSSSR